MEFDGDKLHSPDSFKIAVKNLCGLLINVYDPQLFFLHQTVRLFLTAEPDPDSNLLQEAAREAVSATSNPRTKSTESLPLIFCPPADESGDDSILTACLGNFMTVAAINKCGYLRPASESNINILVLGEDIEADAPVEVKRYVNETLSSVAAALAAGIASLALMILRTHNDGHAIFRNFLQKHKMMQVSEKMCNGQSGIQIAQLFGNLGGNDVASRWAIANFS